MKNIKKDLLISKDDEEEILKEKVDKIINLLSIMQDFSNEEKEQFKTLCGKDKGTDELGKAIVSYLSKEK